MAEEKVKTETTEEQQLPVVEARRKCGWAKRILRIVAIFVVFLFLLPSLLYIPAIQRAAKNFVEEKVSESTGYSIRIGELSLKFPLRLSVADILVLDEHRDTMVCGNRVDLNVRLLSLLAGDVTVGGVDIDKAYYRMVSSDTSMVLNASLRSFVLSESRYGILSDHIDLGEAIVDGVDASIDFDNRKAKAEPKDTTQTTPLLITLDKLTLKDVNYRMAMMPTIESLSAKIASGELRDLTVNMKNNLVRLDNLSVSALDAEYYQPTEKAAAALRRSCLPIPSLPTQHRRRGRLWRAISACRTARLSTQ